MTVKEILKKAILKYKLSPMDAEILLSLAAKTPREHILAHPEKELTKYQMRKFLLFAEQRSAGKPMAYISGKKEFYGFDFIVNNKVLIPRPETELLVECTLKKIINRKNKMPNAIIDIGTGSGNIVTSIVKNLPKNIRKKTNFYAVDISKESLRIARKNAKEHRAEKGMNFINSDLLSYFIFNKIKFPKNVFIVANLPYVSPEIYKKYKSNLRFEPKKALISPVGGLAHYKKLLEQARALFTNHCLLFLEISPEQKSKISRIIGKLLPDARTSFYKDLAGKWRIVEIEISS